MPTARTEQLRLPAEASGLFLSGSSRWARAARSVTVALVVPCTSAAGACEPWDDAAPPATAASATSKGNVAAQEPVQLNADPAGDAPRHASAEYTIGADEPAAPESYDDDDPSALSDFRPVLEPYGTWVDDPQYGTVWVPSPDAVGPDFRPYVSGGHWAYDDDYVWVSDYPWGWAPFHYGRWVFIDGRGWVWIPGRTYRGAWVTWSVDDDYSYLGWAPLGPAFVWFGGAPVVYRGYWGPRWSYCARGDVFAPRVGVRILAGPAVASVSLRMRPFAPEATRVRGVVGRPVAGPPPARFGYAAAQIPRATAPGVVRAREFARPATARALGGAPPVRVQTPAPRIAAPGAAPATRPAPLYRAPGYRAPAVVPAPVYRAPANPAPVRVPAAGATPVYRAPPAVRTVPAPRPPPPVHGGGAGPHR